MTVKIQFLLDQDDDGFPPIRVELINATPLEGGCFRLENAPFFVDGISYHDVVEATPSSIVGQFEFVRVVQGSEFVTLSIIMLDERVDAELMALLRGMDCVVEYGEFGAYRVLAVALPPQTPYAPLRKRLLELVERGSISLAELALGSDGSLEGR